MAEINRGDRLVKPRWARSGYDNYGRDTAKDRGWWYYDNCRVLDPLSPRDDHPRARGGHWLQWQLALWQD